jgi:hypothetical protein
MALRRFRRQRMRVFAAAMMLLLVAMTGQGLAQSSSTPPPPPGVSPEDAQAGCVRTDLRRCMIALGSAFWFDMTRVTAQIARRNELDVNGNTAHRSILLDAKLPHHVGAIGVTLTLASPAPNDEVVKVALNLPEDPDLAHTGSDYDRTQLYDIVSVVLGSRCPALDKMALYRFYENSLKPLEKPKIETRSEGPYRWVRSRVDTGAVPFCGAVFSVHRDADWLGPYLGVPGPNENIVGRGFRKGLLTIDIE